MSEADPPIDIDADALAELVQMDLAAARHANAQFLAATAPDEINGLGRTYQRMARSLRQSLALKAKLNRDAAIAAKGQSAAELRAHLEALRIDRRVTGLQDAVGRVIAAATGADSARTRAAFDRLDREMDDWELDALFGLESLGDHVAEVCEALGLPETLARDWRKLPKVVFAPDPTTNTPATHTSAGDTETPADPPIPESDTG